MELSQLTKLHEDIYDIIDDSLNGEPLDAANIIVVVVDLMRAVEEVGGMSGEEKRTLVTACLEVYIKNNVDDKVVEEVLLMLLSETIPYVIVTFKAISNNEVVIKAKKKLFRCC
jgi:hypothetical protein